jgi:microcompartment protein CcmL/EutN
MSRQLALGLIETIGLAAGIDAADVAVKAANVRLIGYELTKGDGMTVVKIEGNVGAVKAAVDAAKSSAEKVCGVFSVKVIPRPNDGINYLIENEETVGLEIEKPAETETVVEEPVVEEPVTGDALAEEKAEENTEINDNPEEDS